MISLLLVAAAEESAKADHGMVVFFLDRYGMPIAVLVLLCWTILRCAKWLAPRIDRLVDRHDKLISTLELELSRHGEVLSSMEQNQSHMLDCLHELARIVNGSDVGGLPKR